jgi:hypothetical protein
MSIIFVFFVTVVAFITTLVMGVSVGFLERLELASFSHLHICVTLSFLAMKSFSYLLHLMSVQSVWEIYLENDE